MRPPRLPVRLITTLILSLLTVKINEMNGKCIVELCFCLVSALSRYAFFYVYIELCNLVKKTPVHVPSTTTAALFNDFLLSPEWLCGEVQMYLHMFSNVSPMLFFVFHSVKSCSCRWLTVLLKMAIKRLVMNMSVLM